MGTMTTVRMIGHDFGGLATGDQRLPLRLGDILGRELEADHKPKELRNAFGDR
jgi:hypothetical protein